MKVRLKGIGDFVNAYNSDCFLFHGFKVKILYIYIYIYIYVCVCVCERERERERETTNATSHSRKWSRFSECRFCYKYVRKWTT